TGPVAAPVRSDRNPAPVSASASHRRTASTHCPRGSEQEPLALPAPSRFDAGMVGFGLDVEFPGYPAFPS
ncbi:MAG: hypothetical protein ACTHMX_07845, partial [Thermomicrobiales bacterium]